MFQIDFGNTEDRIVGIDLGTTNSLVAVMEPDWSAHLWRESVPSIVSVADDRIR